MRTAPVPHDLLVMVGVVLAPGPFQVRSTRLGVEAQVDDRGVEDGRVDRDRRGDVDRDCRCVQKLTDVADAVRRVVGGEAGRRRAARRGRPDLGSAPRRPGRRRHAPRRPAGAAGSQAGRPRRTGRCSFARIQHIGDLDAVGEVALRAGGIQHDPPVWVEVQRPQAGWRGRSAGSQEVWVEVRRSGDGDLLWREPV